MEENLDEMSLSAIAAEYKRLQERVLKATITGGELQRLAYAEALLEIANRSQAAPRAGGALRAD